MELYKSLEKRTKLFSDPFKHFEINQPLTQNAIDEICAAEIADPRKQNLNYDGTRALDGLSLIHISEPTRRTQISYAVFCL